MNFLSFSSRNKCLFIHDVHTSCTNSGVGYTNPLRVLSCCILYPVPGGKGLNYLLWFDRTIDHKSTIVPAAGS